MTKRAAILLGGNLGDVERTLGRACRLLEERAGRIAARSQVMWSEAWGFEAAEPFGNCAIAVETELEPEALLDVMQSVERDCGRDREAECREKSRSGSRYASRTLDADLIFYDERVIATERLSVPHPRVAERAFALRPLAEIMPHYRDPRSGHTVEQMLREVEK
ncbi:MAG: 2-amino-4-hydroxy-6-hydroxymethyldihydropteridine diphosphokinase [Alistipes sp.]|nr:2-amino-4-hydroxy-6-hydroxymethyldihydropteridine diphosphokinase [Alistipes sp.]